MMGYLPIQIKLQEQAEDRGHEEGVEQDACLNFYLVHDRHTLFLNHYQTGSESGQGPPPD